MDDATRTPSLWTVGHGRVAASQLVALLGGAGIDRVVDVRRYPGSRRNPQFGREALAAILAEATMGYRWMPELGGRRRPGPESPHRALRQESFRAYADHMDTDGFRRALDDLLVVVARERVVVLCAEAVWWRCHRRLIADAVTLLHGVQVEHLHHDDRRQPHVVTDGARRAGRRLVYDVGPQGRVSERLLG